MVLKFPRLYSYSLSNIKHVIGYLRFELNLSATQVKRVIYQSPQVIGLNTDSTLKGKVGFLQESLGLSSSPLKRELQKVVSGMPTLLVLSSEKNLQPKISFLLNAMQKGLKLKREHDLDSFRSVLRNSDDADAARDLLRSAVLRSPTLLGYSLEKRIQPRMEAILDAGVDPTSITIGISMKEDKFLEWLDGRKRRVQREKEGREQEEVKATIGSTLDPMVANKKPAESSGRIQHWTRPRRPSP